eukprot:Pompholyxophrys_punicea_v1_NODE_521_length_1777_cov_3.376307.p2 type:complete len:138 gc:universal NODE_521_length_1777_cov_3.376307:647-234(-)
MTSRDEVDNLYEHLKKNDPNNIVDKCTASNSASFQADLIWDLKSGTKKVVVCSSVLGQGINLPVVRNIISYGVPQTVSMIWQMFGRAGRDQNPANAFLIYPEKIPASCSPDLVELINSGMCSKNYFTPFGRLCQQSF